MRRLLLCLLLPFLLLCCAPPLWAAESVFPTFMPKPYRDQAAAQAILQELGAIMEEARTLAADKDDLFLGRIHDLAAGLRYPLTMGDTLAGTLDALVNARSDKARRDAALQTARVAYGESVESVRAWLRAIRDLRAETAMLRRADALALLDRLETNCFASGAFLENTSKRCLPPAFTAPVRREQLLFINENQAQRLQNQRNAFLDTLSTDRNQQNFLGGLAYEKVSALRFPLMDAIRLSFFMERLFEGTDNATMRATALIVAQAVLDRHILTLRQAMQHIAAIQESRQGRPLDTALLAKTQDRHQDTLYFLEDVRGRLNRAQP